MSDRTKWRTYAACATKRAGSHDERSERETMVEFRSRIERAKSVCARCPVAPDCLLNAALSRDSGIRAGFLLHSGKQSVDLRLPHGTVATYRRHLREGTRTCVDCRRAWADLAASSRVGAA